MEIEKILVVSAPRDRVWNLLLDPHVMTGAVPGMKSIDVISPTEYMALMQVKISFVSAKFKLHTNIVEQRAPEYLRAEGTGEDTSVASSLKQTSEVFLTPTPDGGTELRIKVNVDVLGRLGTFGLAVMKTKADRMWDEFSKNLATRIDQGDAVAEETSARPEVHADPSSVGVTQRALHETTHKGWLARLLEGKRPPAATIRVEVRQADRTVTIEWPIEAAGECQDWLRELLGRPAI